MNHLNNPQPMSNIRMQEKLTKNEAFDVCVIGRELPPEEKIELGLSGRVFEISPTKAKVDGMDYCCRDTEEWIWSGGIDRLTGKVYVSTMAEFYMNSDFECFFLR